MLSFTLLLLMHIFIINIYGGHTVYSAQCLTFYCVLSDLIDGDQRETFNCQFLETGTIFFCYKLYRFGVLKPNTEREVTIGAKRL